MSVELVYDSSGTRLFTELKCIKKATLNNKLIKHVEFWSIRKIITDNYSRWSKFGNAIFIINATENFVKHNSRTVAGENVAELLIDVYVAEQN